MRLSKMLAMHRRRRSTAVLLSLFAALLPFGVAFPFHRPRRERSTSRSVLQLKNDSVKEVENNALSVDRRSVFAKLVGVAAASATTTFLPAQSVEAKLTADSNWPLWPALPVAPYQRRKTLLRQVADGVYTFDQLIGIYYVQVPIRMTVISLSDGLFVYAPIAPTGECLDLLQPLIDRYGPVKYIVLPSVAVEHKVNAGPFARKFPDAEFYVTDQQYSFPLELPNAFLGLPSWTKPLPESSKGSTMWNGELDHEVLTVKPGIASQFQEAAFFHKASQSLLLCDTLVAVNDEPPEILTAVPEYTRALLFHARDEPLELVQDTPEARRKGWRRIVLLFNFFFPGAAQGDLGLGPLLRLGPYKYGWAGWKPFEWKSEEAEKKAFAVYSNNSRAAIFPIIQIILARGNSGQATQEWVDKVSQWKFGRVIPQHLDAPLTMGPKEFRSNFEFIAKGVNEVRFCDEDVQFLREAEEGFLNFSVYQSSLGPLRGKSSCGL